MDVVVFGASGFIGRAVSARLSEAPHRLRRISAPRLEWETAVDHPAALWEMAARSSVTDELAASLRDARAIVNCAGSSEADGTDDRTLLGANALLPVVVAAASHRAGVRCLIHVSSAAVQGNRPLDESESLAPFSPYSRAKATAEVALRTPPWSEGPKIIRYRPGSVHGPGRRTTRQLIRVASSPFAAVAAPGDHPSPQTHVANVATAIALLVERWREAPDVAMHPWEGFTVRSILQTLSGREPRQIPIRAARAAVAALRRGPVQPGVSRRVELMLLGQPQAASSLGRLGYVPLAGPEDWSQLRRAA